MTQQQSMIDLLRSILRDVSDRPLGDIDPDTPIAQLGIDSISVAEIVVRLEDHLGVEVAVSEWIRVQTVQDFLDVISRAQPG
jgi:acyl carrier protein